MLAGGIPKGYRSLIIHNFLKRPFEEITMLFFAACLALREFIITLLLVVGSLMNSEFECTLIREELAK